MRGSSITLEGYTVEEALGIFREAGFTSVEMWKHYLRRCKTNDLRQKFVKYAADLGITMGGFNAVGEDYFQPFGTDSEMEQTLAGLKSDMESALSLGTRDVLVWEGRAPFKTSESDWLEQHCPRLIELFSAAISFAKPHGARFLVEPHPFTVGMSDRVLIKLCDSLGSRSESFVPSARIFSSRLYGPCRWQIAAPAFTERMYSSARASAPCGERRKEAETLLST